MLFRSGLYSLVWAEEAARAMFLWLTLLGASAAILRDGHFRLDMIEKWLPDGAGVAARMAAHATVVLLGAALVATGYEMVRNSATQFTNALGISLAAVYLAVPVGGALFVVFGAMRIWRIAREDGDDHGR